MDTKQKIQMAIDTAMTLLSVVLMGGTVLFPDDRVHQVLGMVLLALWLVHTVLHRAWYAALFRGKYPPYRVMQIVVNGGISACALLLMASGMMMAWFVPSELVGGALGFARTAHLVSSHWYYLFMCAHLGMHIGMIFNRIKAKRAGQTESADRAGDWRSADSHDTPGHRKPLARKVIFRVLLALVCGYGVYAFIVRGIGKYLFLRQQFFFLDLERGYLLFAVDYLAILVLFAAASHYLSKALLAIPKRKRSKHNGL